VWWETFEASKTTRPGRSAHLESSWPPSDPDPISKRFVGLSFANQQENIWDLVRSKLIMAVANGAHN
jgi:hypothetical protein